MISRQKQNKHSICGKENWRIHQAVLADVRVLGEVASVRCVSCANSFCLNILLRLDMTHTDLSPSPAPPITDASTRRPVFLLHRPSGLLGQGPSQRPRGRPHNAPSLLREFHAMIFRKDPQFFFEKKWKKETKRRGLQGHAGTIDFSFLPFEKRRRWR